MMSQSNLSLTVLKRLDALLQNLDHLNLSLSLRLTLNLIVLKRLDS